MSFNRLLLENGDILLLESGEKVGREDLQVDSTVAVPPASATASALAPSISITLEIPVASASASFPTPGVHGGTPGVDLPTSLEMDRVTALALTELTTDLAVARLTDIAFPHFTVSTVQPRSTGLSAPYRTTLEITMETTLELHDRELELVLDG